MIERHGEELDEDFEPALGFEYFQDVEEVLPIVMHPVRRRAYVQAVIKPVSAKELAAEHDVPLQRMSYHVRLLADAGLLRAVRRTPRRGAVETHYRAVATLEVNDVALAAAAPETRAMLLGGELRSLLDDVLHAAESGASDEPDFFHARAHFVVDSAGRERLAAELRDFYRRLDALEKELRVPLGEGVHEVNVVLGSYVGARLGGRHGAGLIGLSDDFDTIPAEYPEL